MSYDHDGNAGDPRNERQEGSYSGVQELEEADGRGRKVSNACGCDDEREAIRQGAQEIAGAASDGIEEIIANAMMVKGWSGLLPDPDSFGAFPKEVQDKMIEWNDAKILDESRRLDRIVDEVVLNSKRDSWFSFILNLVFSVGSIVLFFATKNPFSFGLLSIPGINIVFNFAKEAKGKDQKLDNGC